MVRYDERRLSSVLAAVEHRQTPSPVHTTRPIQASQLLPDFAVTRTTWPGRTLPWTRTPQLPSRNFAGVALVISVSFRGRCGLTRTQGPNSVTCTGPGSPFQPASLSPLTTLQGAEVYGLTGCSAPRFRGLVSLSRRKWILQAACQPCLYCPDWNICGILIGQPRHWCHGWRDPFLACLRFLGLSCLVSRPIQP